MSAQERVREAAEVAGQQRHASAQGGSVRISMAPLEGVHAMWTENLKNLVYLRMVGTPCSCCGCG